MNLPPRAWHQPSGRCSPGALALAAAATGILALVSGVASAGVRAQIDGPDTRMSAELRPAKPFEGSWAIESVNERATGDQARGFMRFGAHRVRGRVGCSSFSASYVTRGDALVLNAISVRHSKCSDPDDGNVAMGVIREPMVVRRDGDMVQLINPPSEITLRRTRRRWRLGSLGEGGVPCLGIPARAGASRHRAVAEGAALALRSTGTLARCPADAAAALESLS